MLVLKHGLVSPPVSHTNWKGVLSHMLNVYCVWKHSTASSCSGCDDTENPKDQFKKAKENQITKQTQTTPVNMKRAMSPVDAAGLTAGNILKTVLNFVTCLYRSVKNKVQFFGKF